MHARIVGLILRAPRRQDTAQFYAALGLTTTLHQHGGPFHFEVGPTHPGFVTEIYTKSDRYHTDALMVEVASLDQALEIARSFSCEPFSEVTCADNMRGVYITDPDGRHLLLCEIAKADLLHLTKTA